MDFEPSNYQADLHPSYERVKEVVHRVFSDEWRFNDNRARETFLATDFPKLFCHVYPKADPDRIETVSLLFTLLFLMDDALEAMSIEAGTRWYERLYPLACGVAQPDEHCADERLMFRLWADMRAIDEKLTNLVLEPCFVFMRAQVASDRNKKRSFGEYIRYRLGDVGTALIAKMGCFALKIEMSDAAHALMLPLEENFGKHVLIANDVYSYDKEARAVVEGGHPEGAAICSAIPILSNETGLSTSAVKRFLMHLVREYEMQHFQLAYHLAKSYGVATPEQLHPCVSKYIRCLRDAAAGTEAWNIETMRYAVPNKPHTPILNSLFSPAKPVKQVVATEIEEV